MAAPNILITGGSGYLGGALLALLKNTDLPTHGTIFALVRTEKQAELVTQYGVVPITFDVHNKAAVETAITSKNIPIVFWLADALKSQAQVLFINALAELKESTGQTVHFLHTSGAKIFSSLAAAPTDGPLLDTDPGLYQVQQEQQLTASNTVMKTAVETNNIVISLSKAKGVRSYVFVPCIVYGKGLGFGNPISIQTVAIVKAALAAKRVYRVNEGRPTWPVAHVYDTATLYITLLRSVLAGANPDYNENGYYLASPGSLAWDDLYDAIAKALLRRGAIENTSVNLADDKTLGIMAKGLNCPKEMVEVMLGGKCTLEPKHGLSLGWKPKYSAEHAIESADDEVDLILKHI